MGVLAFYSPECVEGKSPEVRAEGVLGSPHTGSRRKTVSRLLATDTVTVSSSQSFLDSIVTFVG
jgi:hypothetical protein